MPVPVSPDGHETSRDADEAAGDEDHTSTQPQQQQQQNQEATVTDPDVMAGYRDCLKETLRFLVEEEQLPGDHPVVRGLVTHLTRQHAHVELTKISQQMMDASAPAPAQSPTPASPINTGYQVTLVEEDEDNEASDEEMSEYDELTDCEYDEVTESEDLHEGDEAENEAHEAFRRQLLRLVYQGCDLFAAPPPPPQPGLMLQL